MNLFLTKYKIQIYSDPQERNEKDIIGLFYKVDHKSTILRTKPFNVMPNHVQ